MSGVPLWPHVRQAKIYLSNVLETFQGDTSVVVLIVLCLGVEFLCCMHLMCIFIFWLGFGN